MQAAVFADSFIRNEGIMENIFDTILESKTSILLVEDNPAQSKLLKRWIETAGDFNITIVENGTLGLKSIQEGSWDLVISDIHVPGTNGLEITRMMKTENISTPILLVTAHEGLGAANQALRDMADAWLPKPFSKAAILEKIMELLGLQKEKPLTEAA
jgi:two-component system, OmpR family, response regulator